jgi:hypothetical protein
MNCDLDKLHRSFEVWFNEKGFRVQSSFNHGVYFTQARKKGVLRTLAGASRALFLKIDGDPNRFRISTGTGKWVQNITATALTGVLTGGITWVTGSILTGWQKKIEKDLWSFIEKEVDFNRDTFKKPPESVTSPIYPREAYTQPRAPPVREREIIKEIEVVYCTYCGTKNNARSSFCITCGARLH